MCLHLTVARVNCSSNHPPTFPPRCSLLGLHWWASILHAYVCLRGFSALVSDCLCMPHRHVSLQGQKRSSPSSDTTCDHGTQASAAAVHRCANVFLYRLHQGVKESVTKEEYSFHQTFFRGTRAQIACESEIDIHYTVTRRPRCA